jgi:hypothetical protein
VGKAKLMNVHTTSHTFPQPDVPHFQEQLRIPDGKQFSQAYIGAEKRKLTLKNLPPPGETSNMLAMLPHLRVMCSVHFNQICGLEDLPIAVIWSAPNCAQSVIVHHRIALHAKLMGTQYVLHPIDFQKLFDNR